LQQLKASPATSGIPVIILSVIPSTERAQLAGDAQGWVQKPFNENLLLAELERVLRVKRGTGQILLVEQDPQLAQVMVGGFQRAGIRVDHASTLQQAVDRCLLGSPDLLILDLALPDGDGFSLVDWLRRQPALRTLPLVVYTGRELSEAETLKLRLGPTHFLDKAKVPHGEVEALALAMVHQQRNPAAA
jgi:DNA-binding response OmpR family regulator